MKKLLSCVLAAVLCLNLALSALAEETAATPAPETGASESVAEESLDISEQEAISIIIYDLEQDTPEVTPTNPVTAGITPDSPFYFLDKLIESIRLALAKTPEARAELLAAISKERLAEIEALDAAKLDQYLDTLLNEVTTALEQAAALLGQAQSKSGEITELMATLKLAADLGSDLELPEALRKNAHVEEAAARLTETTRAIKVHAAVVRGVDETVVVALRNQGLGYGQIALLDRLAKSITDTKADDGSAQALAEVMVVFAANNSIGQTMKAFNSNPGQAKRQALLPTKLVDDADDEADTAAVANRTLAAPGNSAKAKAKTPAKGKGR